MELLTPDEVAAMLKVKRTTVIRWLQKTQIPGFKLGGSATDVWRIDSKDFDKYLAGRSGKPKFDISVEDLERKAVNLKPDLHFKATYTVEIGGKIFPVKQLLLEMTGLPIGAITTLDAYNVFDKLGYSIKFQRIL